MNAVVTIRDYWEVIVGVVFLIAWFVRLEVNQAVLRRDFDEKKANDKAEKEALWQQMKSIQDTCSQVLQSVARLEGKLDSHQR